MMQPLQEGDTALWVDQSLVPVNNPSLSMEELEIGGLCGEGALRDETDVTGFFASLVIMYLPRACEAATCKADISFSPE